jgi:putative hydrolase of HD superfamily
MKIDHPDETLVQLQQLVIDFALIDRNHYLAKHPRRENDVEHTLAVTLLCWYIIQRHQLKLDIGKVLKYAIAHDLVEVYAGDTNAFASEQKRKEKVDKEKASLDRLAKEFVAFPDLITSMRAYETKSDEESLFVWTVDKMQALIMADMDGWRPFQELNIDYEWFVRKHNDLHEISSTHSKEIFKSLLEYCQSSYYDQPN